MKGGCWIATSVLLPGQRLVERNHSAANIHYHPRKRKTDSEGRIETQRAELTALKGYSQALKPNQKKKKKANLPTWISELLWTVGQWWTETLFWLSILPFSLLDQNVCDSYPWCVPPFYAGNVCNSLFSFIVLQVHGIRDTQEPHLYLM